MHSISRRRFLSTSPVLAASCASDLGFLAPPGHAAAQDTRPDPNDTVFSAGTDRLLGLIRTTAPGECVAVFAKEIKNGLSYQQFLTVLFLAAVENGDPYQVAQVYGAHRISSEARVEVDPLYLRGMAIDEAAFGKDHPIVARDLCHRANLLLATDRRAEAEPLASHMANWKKPLPSTASSRKTWAKQKRRSTRRWRKFLPGSKRRNNRAMSKH